MIVAVVIVPVVIVAVVNVPAAGVVDPIAAGAAHVEPSNNEALRLATTVVEITVNGAVPIAIVEINWVPVTVEDPTIVLDAVRVVKAPVFAVVAPIGSGIAHVLPTNRDALRLGTTVVFDPTLNGAVGEATDAINWVPVIVPVQTIEDGENAPEVNVVNVPAAGVVEPIAAGEAHVFPSNREELRLATATVEFTINGAVTVTVEINWVPWTVEDPVMAPVELNGASTLTLSLPLTEPLELTENNALVTPPFP